MSEANLTVGHGAGVMEERPFAIPSKKLVMWLFIISDACTFGAMLLGYGYLRNAAPDWPHHFGASSIINVAIMTFVMVRLLVTRRARCVLLSSPWRWAWCSRRCTCANG